MLFAFGYELVSAYVEGDYTKDTVANYVSRSETNVNFGYLELPDPTADTILTNGATAVIAATDALSAFPATHQFFDKSDDNTYADGHGVISSADAVIGAGDTVITTATGVLETFSGAFAETGATTAIGWIDNITDDNTLEATEDVVSIVANLAQVADGLLARTFETDIYFLADNSTTTVYNATNDNAVVEDVDGDGFLTAGDDTVIAGLASIYTFDVSDDICFDGSVSDDAEYDVGEVIWRDDSGGFDCGSFTTGVDYILVGAAAPIGTSTEFGTENEVGFMDSDGTGANGFTCARLDDCEALVYSGADGVDLSDAGTLPATATFFDSSTEATDGIAVVGDAWDEAGNALLTNVQFSSVTTNGETEYVYLDADTNTDFTATDPIMQVIDKGADNIASGQDFRSFKDNDYRMFDQNDDGIYDDGTDGIVGSSDNDLDPADSLIVTQAAPTPVELEAFLASHRFHDHDSSGAYADGDDIVNDSDTSTYYNADDLLSLGITGTGATSAVNADINAFYVYERVGGACAGSGTDTLLGSVVGDVMDENIAITRAPFTAADDITLCFYLDATAGFTAGNTFQAETGTTNPITYSSGADTGGMGLRTGGDALTVFFDDLTATVASSSLVPSATATYTISYTVTNTVPAASNLINTFPAGFDISGMTIACTDDGGAIAGTETILGQIAAVANIGAPIAAGSVVSCTVSTVVNTATLGASAVFDIGPAHSGTSLAERDNDETVTIANASSGGSSYSIPDPTWDVEVTSPNGGEAFLGGEIIDVVWKLLGTGSVNFVNLSYSIDAGETWMDIVKNTSSHLAYKWEVPIIDTAHALVRVATTDLVSDLFIDESDGEFSIGSPEDDVDDYMNGNDPVDGNSTSDESGEGSDGESGSEIVIEELDDIISCDDSAFPEGVEVGDLVIGYLPGEAHQPAVFYIGSDCMRRPYFNESHYFSYGFTDFSQVEMHLSTNLSAIILGDYMPIKPGSILVKSITNNDVYYINDTGDPLRPELYHIPNEEIAAEYFGEDWSRRIVETKLGYLDVFLQDDNIVTEFLPDQVLQPRYLSDLHTK